MAYNFLRKAKSIKNSFLCAHDNLDGYSSDFHTNGDVDGWDVYKNVYLYGSWNSILFGTSGERECYIGRSDTFPPIEAENYYHVKIMMKITNNNLDKVVQGLTQGKIRWLRTNDNTWNSAKELKFDLIADDRWHLYDINLGPAQWWQGNINNLRVYPFIDGWAGDKFAIKYIKISSIDKFTCSNTQCSYYLNYEHNCPGAGRRGSCEAGVSKSKYTTISGVSDELFVNINNYGNVLFRLGDNENVEGFEMARIVAMQIQSLNIGSYTYAECEYTEFDKLKITSGTTGLDSSVTVSGSAAEALGFYSEGIDVSIKTNGLESVDGFDYASSRMLTASEINKLIDGNIDTSAYTHDPLQYNIEGGRRDFNEIGNGRLLSSLSNEGYYKTLNNKSRTLIDYSHPINNNGRLKHIYVFGVKTSLSKIKILRPNKDGLLTVIYSLPFPQENSSYIYTATPSNYRIDCDVRVNRGDLLGVYATDIYVGASIYDIPDAVFCQIDGEATGTFDPGEPYVFGIGGFAIYARGDRWQSNVMLDIDLGDRINVEEINVYGKASADYFEYNIAICLDVNWEVNLFGGRHTHEGYYALTMLCWIQTHQNIAYGLDALDDGLRTPDNGQEGDGYYLNNGVATTGPHSYFYVNGDAEWLYSHSCDGKHEYCGDMVATDTYNFSTDPIQLTLTFPYESDQTIHKSIIYFKEKNNFRNLALSYYLGSIVDTGNSDNIHYNYIPNYTSIRLDGILFLPDDGSVANDYIFKNPMDEKVKYLYGDNTPINWETVFSASQTDWNIIEHNFDDITCKGFRILTRRHYSTKINEIEVYSKMKQDASLVDKIFLSFSDEGVIWNTASFIKQKEGSISSFIGAAPRYLRLELNSATEFDINEIELLVGDDITTKTCEDVVLLDETRQKVINPPKALEIVNNYDKAFDLSVDLPAEVSETDNIVFWSTLNSQAAIDGPKIGPSCKLFKSADYPIRNDNAQCAINVPAYGLKNLIDGKKAYYTYYEDVGWEYFGILSSGVSIDFSNSGRESFRVSEISFDSLYEGTYWKIDAGGVKLPMIDGLFVYKDDQQLEIEKIYYESSADNSSQLNFIESNGVEINITPSTSYNDNFTGTNGDPPNSDLWQIYNGPVSGNSLSIYNNKLRMVLNSSAGTDTQEIRSKFKLVSNFDIQIDWTQYGSEGDNRFIAGFGVFDDSGNVVDIRKHEYYYAGYQWVVHVNGLWTNYASWHNTNSKFRIVRIGNIFKFYTYDSGWTLRETYLNAMDNTVYVKIWGYLYYHHNSVTLDWDNFIVNSGVPIGDAFGFKLKNGNSAIDKIRIYHTPYYYPDDITIRTSNDNGNNYAVAGNVSSGLSLTINNQKYYSYLAIDLEKRHDIGLIRNYGDSTNKALMSISEGVAYSNMDTSDINAINLDEITGVSLDLYKFIGSNGDAPNSNLWDLHNNSQTGTGQIYNNKLRFSIPNTSNNETIYVDSNFYVSGDFDVQIDYTLISYNKPSSSCSYMARLEIDFADGGFSMLSVILCTDNKVKWVRDGSSTSWASNTRTVPSSGKLRITRTGSVIKCYHWTGSSGNLWAFDGDPNGFQFSESSTSNVVIRFSTNANINSGVIVDWNNFQLNSGTVVWPHGGQEFKGSKDDARWLFCELLCGDSVVRTIRKLGVYPDIGSPVCIGGGYNCEWQSFGNILSDYETPINVAYNATVTGTNQYNYDSYPINAVNGVHTDYNMDEVWGFSIIDGVYPYLELDLGEAYVINKVVLYHGLDPSTNVFKNIDYIFSVSPTISGTFTTVFSISGNSSADRTHYFDPVVARRARLTIIEYEGPSYRVFNPDTDEYELVSSSSFLREIEVYTYTGKGWIDSEDWPVVCIDLKDQFNITDHLLLNRDGYDSDTNWSNSEEFFTYSDSHFNDPKKVAFSSEGEYKIQYAKIDSSGDMNGSAEYVFDYDTYFDSGPYLVEWDTYENYSTDEISLTLDGIEIIDAYSESTGGGWVHQTGRIDVNIAGFYTVKGVQHVEDHSTSWGIRNPTIYRSVGLIKWVSVIRDTAENYSYDNDSDKYGSDYLDKIKIYGDKKYNPTEYSWWWDSNLSELSNDYLFVKEGTRSLKISYPTSSGVDTVFFLEGDDFGQDEYFSAKDLLSFWLYIEDISKIDITTGDITFGVINSSDPIYYTWFISNMSLNNGWNEVKLKFEDADNVVPVVSLAIQFKNKLDSNLDFRNNGRDMTSFRFRYKGLGEAFNLYMDSIKIKRNIFEEDVKFGKGLCLTGYDYLDIPITTVDLERGAIEFWVKPYTDNMGRDIFNNLNSRVFFTLINNNNNIISLGIKSGNWFNPITGHIRHEVESFNLSTDYIPDYGFFSINEIFHLGFVWSNDGHFMDNGDTIRLYINNQLIASSKATWELGDTKAAILRLGGPNTQAAYNNDIWGSGVFANLKVYNYCKTNFNVEIEEATDDIIYSPNRFLEISKDNIHFYNVGSVELPLIFESVPPNEKRVVYVRSNKMRNFDGVNKYTGTLIIDWLTTV